MTLFLQWNTKGETEDCGSAFFLHAITTAKKKKKSKSTKKI